MKVRPRLLWMMVATLLWVATGVVHSAVVFAPGSIDMETEQEAPGVPGDVDEAVLEGQDGSNTARRKNREFVVAPLPSRDPQLGWMVNVPAMFLYKPSSASQSDGVWISGVTGFYAQNKSWGVGGFHKMSIDDDRWRLLGAAFYASLRYDYYGIGGESGDLAIPLKQPTSVGMVQGLREVADNLYVGLRGSFTRTKVQLDIPGDYPGLPDLGRTLDLAIVSPRIEYDTRDSEFYPTRGFYIEGAVQLGLEALGSESNFQVYELIANHYREVSAAGVLAMRVMARYGDGDLPFFMVPAFGRFPDLRGYKSGTYRDRFLTAGQVEYRHRFTKTIGGVVFGGVGTVASGFARWDKTLPSFGFGLRYVLAKENNMAMRVDFAWGRDDSQFYVGLREAF